MSVIDRTPRDWLSYWRAMSDDELSDERFRLYDAAEVAEQGSELAGFVQFGVEAIAIEQRLRVVIREAMFEARADVDPKVVAAMFGELLQFRLALGVECDVDDLITAAVEIARCRNERTGK